MTDTARLGALAATRAVTRTAGRALSLGDLPVGFKSAAAWGQGQSLHPSHESQLPSLSVEPESLHRSSETQAVSLRLSHHDSWRFQPGSATGRARRRFIGNLKLSNCRAWACQAALWQAQQPTGIGILVGASRLPVASLSLRVMAAAAAPQWQWLPVVATEARPRNLEPWQVDKMRWVSDMLPFIHVAHWQCLALQVCRTLGSECTAWVLPVARGGGVAGSRGCRLPQAGRTPRLVGFELGTSTSEASEELDCRSLLHHVDRSTKCAAWVPYLNYLGKYASLWLPSIT